jgi:uncharacterized delta-60 repeat protein
VAGVLNATTYTIIRLNADGSVDNTFVMATISKRIKNILLQPDGKVIAHTRATNTNNNTYNVIEEIIRLNSNGSLDNNFTSMEAQDAIVHTMALQPDGKIILAGGFTTYNGYTSKNLVRLHTNGTIDNTFKVRETAEVGGDVGKLIIFPTGKILAHGALASVSSNSTNVFVQLNTDGTLDDTFILPISYTGPISSIALRTDGRLILSTPGRILNYYTPQEQTIEFAAIPNKQINEDSIKLSANATSGLPVSFSVVSGPAAISGDMVTLTGEAGTVILKASQSGNQYYKAALDVERSFQVVVAVLATEKEESSLIKVYPNPVVGNFVVEIPEKFMVKHLQLTNMQGQPINTSFTHKGSSIEVSTQAISPGLYIIQIDLASRVLRRKIIVY